MLDEKIAELERENQISPSDENRLKLLTNYFIKNDQNGILKTLYRIENPHLYNKYSDIYHEAFPEARKMRKRSRKGPEDFLTNMVVGTVITTGAIGLPLLVASQAENVWLKSAYYMAAVYLGLGLGSLCIRFMALTIKDEIKSRIEFNKYEKL